MSCLRQLFFRSVWFSGMQLWTFLDELKPDSCVNRVKTRRHHLAHESWDKLREAGGPGASTELSALKVTWQLTYDLVACPCPNFLTCLSRRFPLLYFFFLKVRAQYAFYHHVAAFQVYWKTVANVQWRETSFVDLFIYWDCFYVPLPFVPFLQ